MDYDTFVTEFLSAIKNNDKKALTLLDENKSMIQEKLGENANLETMDNFINLLINVIVQIDKKKFDVVKNALKHRIMTTVYRHFQNSNAMIKAVESKNKNALKWLHSMNVSPYIQDENGLNILMHIVQSEKCYSYISAFISDKKCLNQEDNFGRTALFYAINNPPGFWRLVENGIDINHKDHDGNNILIYCCKINKLFHFKYLVDRKYMDVNATNNEGRTAAMYLAMNGSYSLYSSMTNRMYYTFEDLRIAHFDFNYINNQGESVLSVLLKYMYKSINPKKFDSYIHTLISLMLTDCDFNIPIDEDKNNALMVLLLVNDYESFNFIIKHRKNLDLKKQNKNGESVTSLVMKSKNTKLTRSIIDYPTFDIDYTDPTNGNNILMFAVITKPYLIPEILNKKPDFLHEINSKGENALIIACKANNYESVISLLNYPVHININCQDELDNTALHYAVECKNSIIVQELIKKGANDKIKNIEGKTPYDLANELGDENIIEALKCNLTPEIIQVIKNNNQSEALKGIEEYLYPCISIFEYTGINITEDMIEVEKSIFKKMEKEISFNSKNFLAMIRLTPSLLFGL
ncbi:ankyrin [Anaeromyces robustus]|uniref:Ankyrin n=1 Tax=Anaeromyces robustus TaxID=1754192 RepID=A0A1Y1X8W3_9FUNG|nr:ankyrin [Anaeromyces robustus]|eukprot:ORX82172.1 ankyrin [Anaeromyces robustus]